VTADGREFVRAARRVRDHLDQRHRWTHTLAVARVAEMLATAHGGDPTRARWAGLFHDLARLYTSDRLLTECRERGLAVNDFERANPIVLHARLGAELAREMFGVTDEAVLSAIRKHTLGDAEMTPLDEAVYLADALEPGRDYPERAGYLALAFEDLAAAMRAVVASSLAHLRARGHTPAVQTLAAARRYHVPLQWEKQTA
jgi:predicted HD superfamily hydrolase involved in NAD metabolism